jgi:hypothetical protein
MKPPRHPNLRAPAALLALALAAGGCATIDRPLDVKTATMRQAAAAQTRTELPPRRTITGFSAALRCMDTLLADYGVRDVSLLVEEITDHTKKVNAGTRDMLITAMSDMTRRSRALRLVAYGKDTGNAVSFLYSAQRASPYQVVPPYDIKGSISQLDENVIRSTKDLGAGFLPFLNLGISRDAAASVLGLDLSVLTTDDMAVLPGVTSSNSVVILRQGKGLDGDAAYHKFGVSYSMSLSRSDGQTQALRGLVELAAIELAGKLTKVPYWSCLGGDPASSDEVRLEIADWYAAMAAGRLELIGWFQKQLRQRGFYRGPIDGKFNPAIDAAIGDYRAALGLSNEATLDAAFFGAFLAADHSKVTPPEQPATYTPVAEADPAAAGTGTAVAGSRQPAADSPAAPREFALSVETEGQRMRYRAGEPIHLKVRANRDAYVYCYMQDETRRITRFYPNRFDRDALLARGRALELPGRMRFQLVMNALGMKETVTCFASERDVLAELPKAVVGTDLEPLAITSMQPIRDAIERASAGAFTQGTVQYEPL